MPVSAATIRGVFLLRRIAAMTSSTPMTTGLLTIDTQAVVHNWALLSDQVSICATGARCGAVVKANAYGLGVEPIASALLNAGCENFFVATLAEAIELRHVLGVGPKIYVFSGLHHGLCAEWYEYQLIPVIVDRGHLGDWLSLAKRRNVRFQYALKVDTGMGRLGLSPDEFEGLLKDSDFLAMPPVMMMSHLACGDDPSHSLNQSQQMLFASLSLLLKKVSPNTQLSFANSAGIFLGKDFIFDLARPGIALYGGNPSAAQENPMKSVVDLSLPVIQVKSLPKGQSVGYGATFKALHDMKIALVFGGYADGLLRALSNRGYVYYDSYRLPMLGRVSMDSFAVDVTDLPLDLRHTLSSVDILGGAQTVDDLAVAANTSSYEILTNMGQRYHRQYL